MGNKRTYLERLAKPSLWHLSLCLKSGALNAIVSMTCAAALHFAERERLFIFHELLLHPQNFYLDGV